MHLFLLMLGVAFAGRGGGGKRGRGGKGGKGGTHWEQEFFVQPMAGAMTQTDGKNTTTMYTAGGAAGLRYQQIGGKYPNYAGQTRAQATYALSGADATSYDLRLGTFLGPHWKTYGVETGPDVFKNQWYVAGKDLEPTLGVEVPVRAMWDYQRKYHIQAGVAPSWLDNDARKVNWATVDSALPGFGDEFAYFAGASTKWKGFNFGGQYTYRIVKTGVQQAFGVGVSLTQ